MDLISPVAHRVPYMVSIGSHDYDYKASKHANSKDPSKPGKPFLPKWVGNPLTCGCSAWS